MFGNPETTPGGRALKFYSSVRIDIRRIGMIKQTDGVVTGSRTRVKIVKNKVAPPFTEAEFDIIYNEGISSVGSLLDLALDFGILQKRGSWFSYNDTQLAQGRDAAKDALRADPKLYAEIDEAVRARIIPSAPASGPAPAAATRTPTIVPDDENFSERSA
jgi:recombination protein RecA